MRMPAPNVPVFSAGLRVPALLRAHEEDAHDRGDDPDDGDDERQVDGVHAVRRRCAAHRVRLQSREPGHAEDHGSDDGAHVGLEQVRAHAGHVADVVADVVGDGGRVQRVVLRDARFDLAHQVRADVGGLGVDAAAHAGEQRDGGGAQREARTALFSDDASSACRRPVSDPDRPVE